MATEKRQRQDQRRQEKVTVQKQEAAKIEAKQKRSRLLWWIVPAVAVLGIALLLATCNNDDTAGTDDTDAVATTTTTVAPATTLPKAISTKPEVAVPAGAPPKTLQTKDLVVGTGAVVGPTSDVVINVASKVWESKTEVDAWGATQTLTSLGDGPWAERYKKGLLGMKAGGRRQLLVPAELAYGDKGFKDLVKPGQSMVYIVDAVKVTNPKK